MRFVGAQVGKLNWMIDIKQYIVCWALTRIFEVLVKYGMALNFLKPVTFFTVQKSRGILSSSIAFKEECQIFQWVVGSPWKAWQILGILLDVQNTLPLRTSFIETNTGKYSSSWIEEIDTQMRHWMWLFIFMGPILTIEPC